MKFEGEDDWNVYQMQLESGFPIRTMAACPSHWQLYLSRRSFGGVCNHVNPAGRNHFVAADHVQ